MRGRFSQLLAGGFVLLMLGAFALGMLALLGLGLKNIVRGVTSRNWPVTEGVVAKVTMTTSTSRDTRRQTSSTTYNADLSFRYSVQRREYATEEVRWGQTLGSGDPAEAVVLALMYPEGRRVGVSYNPAHPEEAVVKPGLTGSAFLLPGAALVFLLFLIPAGVVAWRLFVVPGPERAVPGPDLSSFFGWFLVIPILMGIPMLVHGVRTLAQARASRSWPVVPGAWLTDMPTNRVPGLDALREHPGFPYVYTYEAASDRRFQCVRWWGQGTASGNDSDAEIETQFPRGQALEVHYDPRDPDTAVLSPGLRGFAWILPGAGAGFILFGTLGIGFARRGRFRPPSPSLPWPGFRRD